MLEEDDKEEKRKEKNRKYDYNSREKKLLIDFLSKIGCNSVEEIINKYEKLQTDYLFEKKQREKAENLYHDSPYNKEEINRLQDKLNKLQVKLFKYKQKYPDLEEEPDDDPLRDYQTKSFDPDEINCDKVTPEWLDAWGNS